MTNSTPLPPAANKDDLIRRFPAGTEFYEAVNSDGDDQAFAGVPVRTKAGRLKGWRSIHPTGERAMTSMWHMGEPMTREAWLVKHVPGYVAGLIA